MPVGQQPTPPVAETGAPEPQLSVARGTAYGLAADAATVVSGLVVAIVVARFLGPANRGVYALAVLVVTLTAIVGDVGMSTSGIVFAANRRVPQRRLHGTALLLSVGVAALAGLLLFGFAGPLSRSVLKGVGRRELWLVAIAILPTLYAQIMTAVLTGRGRLRELSWIRLASATAAPPIMLAAVWASGGSPFWAVVGWLVTMLLLALPVAAVAVRDGGAPVLPSPAQARTLFGFGLRAWIGTMSHHGYLRTDVLFISARLGPAAVGQYSLSSVLAERISLVGSAVYSATASRVGGGDRAAAELLTARLVRLLIIAMVPLAALLSMTSWIVIPAIFGDAFEPAVLPFVLLMPGTVCLTLYYVIGLFIIAALERPGLTTAAQASALLAGLPLYWIAVQAWQMTGAAIVSSCLYAAIFGAGVVIFRRHRSSAAARLLPRWVDVKEARAIVRSVFAKTVRLRHA